MNNNFSIRETRTSDVWLRGDKFAPGHLGRRQLPTVGRSFAWDQKRRKFRVVPPQTCLHVYNPDAGNDVDHGTKET